MLSLFPRLTCCSEIYLLLPLWKNLARNLMWDLARDLAERSRIFTLKSGKFLTVLRVQENARKMRDLEPKYVNEDRSDMRDLALISRNAQCEISHCAYTPPAVAYKRVYILSTTCPPLLSVYQFQLIQSLARTDPSHFVRVWLVDAFDWSMQRPYKLYASVRQSWYLWPRYACEAPWLSWLGPSSIPGPATFGKKMWFN